MRFSLRRRHWLQWAGATVLAAGLPLERPLAASSSLQQKAIPASGELLPVVGLGTWQTFDVGDLPGVRADRCAVLQAFFERGGRLVDSSPMYGRSEEVIGQCLERAAATPQLFAAGKVWTYGKAVGSGQMEASQRLWGIKRFDLMQVHNLLDWQTQLETLREWKAAGRIRYLGVTTSHGRRHDELESLLKSEPLDFVQFTYNLVDRAAELRLLPLAAERGIAVIANRPFRGGALFGQVRGRLVPAWAVEAGCRNWAEFFLKFIVSHPAVTCAIPATARVDHLHENMGALEGLLPDATTRQRMADFLSAL